MAYVFANFITGLIIGLGWSLIFPPFTPGWIIGNCVTIVSMAVIENIIRSRRKEKSKKE
jgi:hypothetical protein